MARLLAESSKRVLVEPYGTYEDYYDTPDEEMHTWVDKTKISTINDEYVDGDQWLTYLNSEDPLELMVSEHTAGRLL
jgi:hypothetical protein